MANKKESRKIIEHVFVLLACVMAVVFLIVGGLTRYGYSFATSSVHDELVSQKIYFPEAGNAKFTPAEYPTLQQYAGQAVDNGLKAKAYADDYIGHHLTLIAGGKTYAEVSTLAMADPTNATLAAQKATLFQGETLRGLLLGDAYSFWVFGQSAFYASWASFAAAAVMILLALFGLTQIRRA